MIRLMSRLAGKMIATEPMREIKKLAISCIVTALLQLRKHRSITALYPGTRYQYGDYRLEWGRQVLSPTSNASSAKILPSFFHIHPFVIFLICLMNMGADLFASAFSARVFLCPTMQGCTKCDFASTYYTYILPHLEVHATVDYSWPGYYAGLREVTSIAGGCICDNTL